MLIKEFLQMLRDPRMRMVIFGMPVIQMVIMAFALTTDVTHIRTAVLDMDKTPSSRELIFDFTAGGLFSDSCTMVACPEGHCRPAKSCHCQGGDPYTVRV